MTYTPILNGNMSGAINGTVVSSDAGSSLCIRAQWAGTGSPSGFFGLRSGPNPTRLQDLGSLTAGNFNFVGAQPNGTASAGSLMVEFQSAALYHEVYYTPTSGGAANTTAIVDLSVKR